MSSTGSAAHRAAARTTAGFVLATAALLAGCGFPEPPPTTPATPVSPWPTASPLPTPSPTPSPTPFPVDCSWLRPVVCERIVVAALDALGTSQRPVAAWLGPPIEQHFPLVSPSFRGTVLFRFADGRERLVLVTYVAGEGIGAALYQGTIPPWYPRPTASLGS